MFLAKSADLGSRRLRKRQIGASSTWLNSLNWVQRVANFSRLPVRTSTHFSPRGVCVDRVSEPRNSDGGTCRVSPWCPLPAIFLSPQLATAGARSQQNTKTWSKGRSLPGRGPQLSEPSRSNRTECMPVPGTTRFAPLDLLMSPIPRPLTRSRKTPLEASGVKRADDRTASSQHSPSCKKRSNNFVGPLCLICR